jgi:cytochrome c biogenesis protein CcdA
MPPLAGLGGGRLGLIAQGVVGAAMLVYAIRAPETAGSASSEEPKATAYAALFLLGVTVTAMELPTAVPYFGAIALLTSAKLSFAQWLPLLVLYNAIFVLPPCCSWPATSCSARGSTRATLPCASASRRARARPCCGSSASWAAASSPRASSSTSRGT